MRFRLNIDIKKEMEDSRLNAIKQPILNFSSKTTTAAKVPLTESLLDNWLKNNHITLDKTYHLHSLFVSFFFLRILAFKFISQPQKTGKQNFVATR